MFCIVQHGILCPAREEWGLGTLSRGKTCAFAMREGTMVAESSGDSSKHHAQEMWFGHNAVNEFCAQ